LVIGSRGCARISRIISKKLRASAPEFSSRAMRLATRLGSSKPAERAFLAISSGKSSWTVMLTPNKMPAEGLRCQIVIEKLLWISVYLHCEVGTNPLRSSQHRFAVTLDGFHLALDHSVVKPPCFHELLVGAALDDAALFHQQDQVGAPHRREAMSDHESRPPGQESGHRCLDE